MRKVIMFNMITLDGFFEGKNKWDIGWHQVDEEFNEFAIDQLQHAGGLIFGRVTYEGMASYWQSPAALDDDPNVTKLMNSLPKFVFSRTLEKASWNNTRLIRGDASEAIHQLKQEDGDDLFIFGSADLSSSLIRDHVIDEYRLMVAPIVLGAGGALFKEIEGLIKMKLLDTRKFHNGNVLLSYTSDAR